MKRKWRRKGERARYFSVACIPRSVRVQGGRKGRKTYAYRARAQKFRAVLARLQGRQITREELCDVCSEVYRVGYVSGYRAGRDRAQPALVEISR